MADTAERTLRLLSLLQSGRRWPAADLAAALGTSPRSLRRDLDRLRGLGYRVESLRGPGGHYRLAPGGALPPLVFEDDEAVALAVALRVAAAGLTGLDVRDDAPRRALRKLEGVLPARLARRVAATAAAVEPAGRARPGVAPDVVAALGEAVAARRRTRLVHRGRSGEAVERDVDPYRLVVLRDRWYLFAWDLDRRDWRAFRLDRVASVAPVGVPFTPRPLPADDLAAHLAERFAERAPRHRVRVLFAASAREVARTTVRLDGALRPVSAETARYEAAVDSFEWAATALALTGLPFTVEGPPEFAAYVAALGERLRAAAPG
ncbi:helix-turn-helix transcriptional regulator [Actinomadura atramentaria]|uniref:helix-turn-helix transcriptional regulator n=1 Tax=Actinomadura atramentaria TaxID=1990 RepID=UPI00036E0FD0|nr:WYL domain-containing protein [Actinomadura atramentaria]